jgi:AcrR family transcriptional regulator
MSRSNNRAASTLSRLRSDLTEQLILDAALQTIERGSVEGLTIGAVAKQAGISERTIFRYFASRELFLDAVAQELARRMNLAPPPTSLDELYAYPRALYEGFEANSGVLKVAIRSELFQRLVATSAKERWIAVRRIIDAYAPRASERARRIAAANIRFYLGASTWHYYRFLFEFSLEDTIACAETAVAQALAGLKEGADNTASGRRAGS